MKVGQICGSSKNGPWVVVDVCISFFLGSLIRAHTGSFANVSGAFDTPNMKMGQMRDIWKNRSWSAVDARNSFFLISFQFDLFFPQKVIKIGVFPTFLPYI